jgi:hypothetical protein
MLKESLTQRWPSWDLLGAENPPQLECWSAGMIARADPSKLVDIT